MGFYINSIGISKGASVKFRDNSLGWVHRNISFFDENGKKIYSNDEFHDLFFRLFKSGVANYSSYAKIVHLEIALRLICVLVTIGVRST